jgi:hypothetical protein
VGIDQSNRATKDVCGNSMMERRPSADCHGNLPLFCLNFLSPTEISDSGAPVWITIHSELSGAWIALKCSDWR